MAINFRDLVRKTRSAIIFLDADLRVERAFDGILVIGHASVHEFKQIIIAAADQLAFNDFKKLRDAGFENFKILTSVIRDGDFGEHVDRISETAAVDPGALCRNKTRRFQSFDQLQAGALRQSHRICQCRIGNAPVLLEFRKYF